MLKTKTWIWIFSVLLVLCLAVTLFLWLRPTEGAVVRVMQDGVCLREIDLAAVTEPYSFTVEDEHGSNTILVEPGRICVSEADCPDQVCVRRGWLRGGAAPIVCLPHRLTIEAAGRTDLDSVSR